MSIFLGAEEGDTKGLIYWVYTCTGACKFFSVHIALQTYIAILHHPDISDFMGPADFSKGSSHLD